MVVRNVSPSDDASAPLLAHPSSPKQQQRAHAYLLPVLYLLILLVDFGEDLQEAPLMQIYEDIICRDYYSKQEISWVVGADTNSCRVNAVQSELAFVNGMQKFLNIMPSQSFGSGGGNESRPRH